MRQVEPPLRDARQKGVQQPEPRLLDAPQWVGRQPEQRGAPWQEAVPQVQPDELALPRVLARPASPLVTQRWVLEQVPSVQRVML